MIMITADGYGLLVNRKAVGKMARGLRNAALGALPFADIEATIDYLFPVLRRARLVKMYFQTGSGKEYPVFRALLNGQVVEFIARSIGRGVHEVVTARSIAPDVAAEAELTEKGVTAHIDWSDSMSLEDAEKQKDTRIVYIVERPEGTPVYVGMSTQTFAERWDERMAVLRQLGLSKMIRIRIGRVTPRNISSYRLKNVEHAVIRAIYNLRLGGPPQNAPGKTTPDRRFLQRHKDILTNMTSLLPFRVSSAGLYITQTNPPRYLQIEIAQKAKGLYELAIGHL